VDNSHNADPAYNQRRNAGKQRQGFMSGQALVYFGISGGTLVMAISLLRKRYIERDRSAVTSRGGYTMFAILMLLFAIGAFFAGYFSRS
jgi:hypothetical protein